MATSFDVFIPQLKSQDTKKRLQLGSDILNYLEVPTNPVETEDLGSFIDSLVLWLNSSNCKVAQNGLEILTILTERLKENFRHYISIVFSAAVDRLGDSKDQVREQAKTFLLKLMSDVASPQYIFEKLVPAFSHRNWRVREEVMICLKETLETHGAHSLSITKLLPAIIKLLSDPNSQVRDMAVSTIVEIYKYIGDRLQHDLNKKYNIPAPKLHMLMTKFEEVRNSGGLFSSADQGRAHDDIDSRSQHSENSDLEGSFKSSKRASSAPPPRRSLPPVAKSSLSASAAAGAVDEEMFIRCFEDVPRIQLYSAKEAEHEISKIRDTLGDPSNHWEKRLDAMKRLRSVLIAGASDYDEVYQSIRQLEIPFQLSVKDLRSQIVREACITIAYLSQQLGPRLDHFSEVLLPSLINLIPNSVKIMSSSGIVAIRFIIQHTHVSRLIPIITYNMTSRSKEIRRICYEFLDQLLHTWPTHTLEKHVANIQDAIKKGISDADPEARAFSRKAFWGFADHFKDQADSLLNSLDTSKQRMLQGELSMSNSSSNSSLNSSGRPLRSSVSCHGGSVENLSRAASSMGGLSRRSGIPILSSPKHSAARFAPTPLRSNSAIDLAAARRAKLRAGATMPHYMRNMGASLPRSSVRRVEATSAMTSPEHTSRSRTKGVSQSQPSSRSGSPSSRLSYATYHYQTDGSGGRVRRKSGIPTATGTSRETSPSRSPYSGHERRLSSGSLRRFSNASDRFPSPTVISSPPLMAERILQQSKEAEIAMADALQIPLRRRYNAFDDQSDESETSSVCSDRSFSSFSRNIDDVSEIIHNLCSVHWSERKEGLLGLQAFLRSSRMLSLGELKRVTDIFTKLFMDPHTKVFTLFLDTLHELIHVHKMDLQGWLYILMTRLFVKTGTDLLGSVQNKIQKTLDLVRDSFPCDEQFNVVMRFLNDQTQTPNLRVKLSLLNYLHSLLRIMDPSEFSSSSTETKLAITKIITWMADPKSSELRKCAQEVIIATFNLNSPEFSILLTHIPKNLQDSAFRLLNSQLRRHSNVESSSFSLHSPPSPIVSYLQSSNNIGRVPLRTSTPQTRSFDLDDTENMNPEEIYNSLKQTSAEIQKYSLGSLDHDYYESCRKLNERSRDSLSTDSSQNVDGKLDTLEERIEMFSSNDSSPAKRSPLSYQNLMFHDSDSRNGFDKSGIFGSNDIEGHDAAFQYIITELNYHNTRNEQRQQALSQLVYLAREGSPLWEENFRNILRLLMETIGDQNGSIRAMAVKALCELLKRQSQWFQDYVEFTILKILEAHKDEEKEVSRAAEICSAIAANVLPPEQCFRTLKPIIMTGEFPMNQAAIKMLTKLVEQQPKNITAHLLPEIMPPLLKAYDNTESSVRKGAVFCMVAIHCAVGEVMKSHLTSLNGSKMKLLNLYIKRAQSQTSTPASSPSSPANAPSSSSSSH
ncbi:CLIP-associating protein 1-like isoform X1 [Centruroides vittatus]|uniref:CLIP-associating protein 1-like isoform X1 n=1 Tax=Centruroides vittatus TaxID=120091 RepID=UPI00350F2715